MSVRVGALLREAVSSAVSQPVASMVTVLVITGTLIAVMLTTGRTVGAQERVLGTIDDAGTRTIQVRAEADAGLTSDVMGRIGGIEGIEWAAAFSPVVDVTNELVRDGVRAPLRVVYGQDLGRLGVPGRPMPGSAYASAAALALIGLPDISGAVTSSGGETYVVAGQLVTPDFLAGFEPLLLVPKADALGDEPVAIVLIIAERPDLVAPVADALVSVLAVDDPAKVSVQTSEALAQLRAVVENQLAKLSRGLLLVMLGVSGALVAVTLFALVMLRRKDFGRRRALGATRGFIITLLLTQTLFLALIGASIGLSTSIAALQLSGDPLPGVAFITALGVLGVVTALLAALVPAILASTREPIRELRVP